MVDLTAAVIIALSVGIEAAALIVGAVVLARQGEQIRAQAEAMVALADSCARITGERIDVPMAPDFLQTDPGEPEEDVVSRLHVVSPWQLR